ncbi:TPA: hypothetical protein ACH3X1_012133 [Trebouxia sp. C0004]
MHAIAQQPSRLLYKLIRAQACMCQANSKHTSHKGPFMSDELLSISTTHNPPPQSVKHVLHVARTLRRYSSWESLPSMISACHDLCLPTNKVVDSRKAVACPNI